MLQGEQSEEHGLGDAFAVRGGDAEDPTFLMRHVFITH
jgi:hypothetical protein